MEDPMVQGANGTLTHEDAPHLDPQVIVDYIKDVLQVTLGATEHDLTADGSILSSARLPNTIQRCTRFAQESQVALYVQKEHLEDTKDAVRNGDHAPILQFTYSFSSELSYSPRVAACLAILKRPLPIDPSYPITSQVQIVNLPVQAFSGNASLNTASTISPFETLHSVLHLALAPYFEAYTKNHDQNNANWSKTEDSTRTGIPGTKKKIAELELSLLHLQQNIEIPELHLTLHPVVDSALKNAQERGIAPNVDLIDPTILNDSGFLNSLQSTVNTWIKAIQAVTKTTRDPSQGTAAQEINFWLSMESALEGVENLLRSDGVTLTMDILRHVKRFQATLSFSADTGLKETAETVQKYNQLMRDFPLDELLSATSLDKVKDALNLIFSHLNRKLRICPYPIRRALPLVEAISADLDKRLHALLHGRTLMHLDFREFQAIMSVADQIWRTWDEDVKEFTNVAREVTRKRNDKFIPIKIAARHQRTQERLKYINTFRVNHEQLQRTIMDVLGPKQSANEIVDGTIGVIVEEIGDVDAVEEVVQAYASLRDVDVLDVSPEGTRIWVYAETLYNERTSRVENTIISRLRDRLATAKTATEMFRVFSKFNALFVRPKIRGAISEYQTQLIDNVKNDIASLHDRFKQQYGHSEAHAMAQLRDLPPVSGAIIWARQIERQLNGYMGKVEDILGQDWALHTEGQKLQSESDMFRKKLDTRPVFTSWLQEVDRRKLSISGRLFYVNRNRAAGNQLELGVNFDSQVIALFKEVRNLIWLQYQIPHSINSLSKDAKRVYPYAVSMMESVRTFAQTNRTISFMSDEAVLLNNYQNDVQNMIHKGMPLVWESFVHAYGIHVRQTPADIASSAGRSDSKHVQFVRDFANSVSVLQSKTATLGNIIHTVQTAIKALETCPWSMEQFRSNLDTVQKAVDQLHLENFSNLGHWVETMNARVEDILLGRLRHALSRWIEHFNGVESAQHHNDETEDELAEQQKYKPSLIPLTHEISIRNQVIYLDPPLDFARASWLSQLHSWIGVACHLSRIKASRYELRLDRAVDRSIQTFSNLPSQCAETLGQAYQAVEDRLDITSSYVEDWLRFQSLWDLQGVNVYDTLGDDLSNWLQLLQEIRKSRSTFDTSELSRSFGHITIDYEQVQMKVNAKYDQWQHEILAKFAGRLANRMTEIYTDVEKTKRDLEGQSLEASSTAQAVTFITIVQQSKRKVKAWAPEIDIFRQGQTTLSRQRYQFPAEWLYVDQIDHEWAALNEVLERKGKLVQDQTDALRAKIIAEDKVVNQKIADIIVQWNEEKPVSGTIPPKEASDVLSSFDSRLSQLRTQFEMVAKAKEALDLPGSADDQLSTILEEVQDFKSVWAALSTIWDRINALRDTPWASVQPRKLRHSLDELIKMSKEMPSRMRQYAAFEHVQSVLRQLLKENSILSDLRSDAIRQRHWEKIFKSLRPQTRYSAVSMMLGDVWDLKLGPSEPVIKEVIQQAQGEMALEEFLKQVKETWGNYHLDLVPYGSKCRLIRGWDDLFAKCSENLNSLQAMRHSPYYKEFEEDASGWEDKLNRIHVLFDVWIDVQRQWVYLEGVFTGNADIKHLLPIESSRFQNINSEFLTLMKKVGRSDGVLEVLGIPGVQKSLERLADLLNKIQKALGEYLERERLSFPRFYFVGDEDLLEIIGNSTDTARISKHLRKMFAGIAALVTDEEGIIVGFRSREDEEVPMTKHISLAKTPKINEWLGALELNMKLALADSLLLAVDRMQEILAAETIDAAEFMNFLDAYPAQIVVLATQICWTSSVEAALADGGSRLSSLYDQEVTILRLLASAVLGDLKGLLRKKCEHMITECVHQRDVIGRLQDARAESPSHYLWQLQMRYDFSPDAEPLDRVHIKMANAVLEYGFEYLGVPERLVRTPLTDRCFLTLTQALCQRLGGSPYGPAGTGKTESVKALGLQLGRFTLVFCCDDTFDFQSMGRIFLGICQVGAWGCFDEFNRLDERILSAVSQQVQNIQQGLRRGAVDSSTQIELVGRQLKVNSSTGIFITMNPGYAGRSNLPDNLKKLFRSVAMSKPDKELIAEVMLYSQGFSQAKPLSRQAVPFFDRCSITLSKQAHYDFGLRALKSVLVSSGGLKRARLLNTDSGSEDEDIIEPQILVQSVRETIAPKLVREDVDRMRLIEEETFPGVRYVPAALDKLKEAIVETAAESNLTVSDAWLNKAIQLYQIQALHHGVMMVGTSGSGKSSIWRTLLQAMQRIEGVEGVCHVIDPKVMSKEALYGSLDSTTREWTDGLFTSILRKIVDNLRGEDTKRHWIVFDGDVDPEWVENLNSVLDDNKLLTLPNGERLSLPSNVRIMFEVETLRYATLATVSRCGMVWFNEDTVTTDMMISNYLNRLAAKPLEDLEEETLSAGELSQQALSIQSQAAVILRTRLTDGDLMTETLQKAQESGHIMEYTDIRALNTLFSLLNKACRSLIDYNIQHSDFPLEPEAVDAYLSKKLLLALVWSFTGDASLEDRKAFGDVIAGLSVVDLPVLDGNTSLIDYDVTLPRTEWTPWQSQVPNIEVNTHSITQTDVVIPTLDTVRHEEVLYSWLAEHKPLILCGPPGSGKTMTLFSALRKLPSLETVGLNFSSATTPDLLLKTFEQYCEYRKTMNGIVLAPNQVGRWLVVFCDEINLPAPDKYGTQRAISLLRQLVEHNGFWRTTDRQWITLERIQFVGACNPPTDAGRTPLGLRFLRHAPVIMVGYPGETSLHQIYGTFNNACLKVIPSLRGYAEPLTKAMVQFYLDSQKRFTTAIQPHYVYSPRELTRWVRGVYEAIRPLENLSLEGLVRIWAHEALRLFSDRLVAEDERKWTDDHVKQIALEHFPVVDQEQALGGPILFSNWLSKNYVSVGREQLRDFVKARLKTFCEEEVDVPLILFNDVLDHVLRIDRVFRQPQGHLILIGVSGSGKTTLSRFVAWMNGLKVFQIKVHGKYSSEDFDDDLRTVLRACGTKGEKICFIMDESNVLDSGFLERMNTLLANAEVPGLFEGDEFASLMTQCKEGAQRQGLLLDSQEELYKWFTQQIVKNLHVVFTMNPPKEGLSSKAATSPALFNRCVLNWFGDWSDQALFQVGKELTQSVDLDRANWTAPDTIPAAYRALPAPPSHRETVVNAMVSMHYSLHTFNARLQKQQGKSTFLTPRHFLDFVDQFVKLYDEKREELEEQQRHLNIGLEKLRETVDKVSDLRKSLAEKKTQLEGKDREANDKLQRMVTDQREAEQRKAASLEIQAVLEKQDKEVKERKDVVLNDLANAEPAVAEAKKSVSNIKRQHLTEVRSMQNPPQGVKLAMESVCTLLGHKAVDWKSIQAIIRRDDFIASIVNYDNEKMMTKNHRAKMRAEYLSKDDFTFEKVNRASKACGPLVQWVEAQVNYSEILDRVGPLRDEVAQLEEAALSTKAEAKVTENTINELEKKIAIYKDEYAALISQTQSIRVEMERVQNKVDRSVRLLDSLSSERGRWEQGSTSFEAQIDTIVGDVLVAAGFIAYSGFFDQQYRKSMMEEWLHHLSLSNIRHKQHNPITEYLSSTDEKLRWQENGLPVDDLCTENAIVLKRFNRYPLIIDPSGRVIEYIQKECSDRRLTVTSFLDSSFVKQLESCLRFGNPILIQDAEYLDPILTHVLNKEYQKTGGRVLIQLGNQEIDFSPSFKVFLMTRDPSATFAPDVCSRTTFVNFTVTQSSLQTQSLNEVLKSERPDVDERRSNLMKMQGEFSVHLRRLEKRLLEALNQSQGNILDDDHVIETLETLKKEAAEIAVKVQDTEGVMADVQRITKDYDVIARSCSAIFSVLEKLHYMNHFYQFSLQYFLDIFNGILRQSKESLQESNHRARIDAILKSLFISTYQKASLTLLQKDRIVLAMLLAQASPYKMDKTLIDNILDESLEGVDVSTEKDRKDEVMALASKHVALKDGLIEQSAPKWDSFLTEEVAEVHMPTSWKNVIEPLDWQLRDLLLVKLFRVDRLIPATEHFVTEVFGKGVLDSDADLRRIVNELPAGMPLALCSSPGFDASYKVDSLVESTNARCTNIAMGSNEGLAMADSAVSNAAANGSWVLIKNVHLTPGWLQSLEKRIESLKPHPDFRLFLSMESSLKIPVNLLRASRVVMYEQPVGIKANMRDSLGSSSNRASKAPVERARVYLLLSFLHAVIQERLRYVPKLGWKKGWEFNDADFECSAFILDHWITTSASGRTNIAPLSIPWPLLTYLITEMYGGKIDDSDDFGRLASLVNNILTPAAFDADHDLVRSINNEDAIAAEQRRGVESKLVMPTGTTWQAFSEWVGALPEREPPTFLGLPPNAEKLLLVGQAKKVLRNLKMVMDMLDEGEELNVEGST
ncbi:MAG: Dynein heavy chain, cytoplasmic [Bogoriella megaspora]|nr:MAG: Dynein heavy chain, cytoplasmic [Bogoriella megaspora]